MKTCKKMLSHTDNRKQSKEHYTIFPKGGLGGFGSLVDYEYLSMFMVGCKLLLIMVREETKKGRLDSRISF